MSCGKHFGVWRKGWICRKDHSTNWRPKSQTNWPKHRGENEGQNYGAGIAAANQPRTESGRRKNRQSPVPQPGTREYFIRTEQAVTKRKVDPVKLARELGCLQAWEKVEP